MTFLTLSLFFLFLRPQQLASKSPVDVKENVNSNGKAIASAVVNETSGNDLSSMQSLLLRLLKDFAAEAHELREKVKEMEQNITQCENEKKELQAKNAELEQQQMTPEGLDLVQNVTDDQQQQKNHWSVNKSHSDFLIFEPDHLKVVLLGEYTEFRKLYAEYLLVPRFGIAYYEVTIIRKQRNYGSILIGFWAKSSRSHYLYWDNGDIYHNFRRFDGYPSLIQGDTIGCGVNMTSRKPIYTKNGQPLNTTNMVMYDYDLLPYLGLDTPGDTIEANFGPNFAYKNISEIFTKQRP